MPPAYATNENLTSSNVFAPVENDSSLAPRRSLSRFAFDRLQSWGITASVESLRSTSRNFLLISVDAEVATATNIMVDHGNSVGEALTREIRALFGEGVNMYGIFWRVEPPPAGTASPEAVLQKAKLELELKLRERRAARVGRPA
jgi:hypothetical protein